MTRDDVIEQLGLAPLSAEGGYFRQTWCARERVPAGALGTRHPREIPLGTAIYYLVTDEPHGFSAMHRLSTDEIFHFYLGDPVEQLLLAPDGASEVVVLGPDLRAGQRVQHVVPGGTWQGTRVRPGPPDATPAGACRWALLGTTMAPGFDFEDFEIGRRAELELAYPGRREWIRSLTPTG